jgi:hypothetical protein
VLPASGRRTTRYKFDVRLCAIALHLPEDTGSTLKSRLEPAGRRGIFARAQPARVVEWQTRQT